MASGGFVEPLPASIGDELRSAGVPDSAVPHVIMHAKIWRAERSGQKRLRGRKFISKIDQLSVLADELATKIDPLPLGVDEAVHNAAIQIGLGGILEEVTRVLRHFDTVLAVARRYEEPKGGRPRGTWQKALVKNVAAMIETYGGKADRSESGALYQAVAILLRRLDGKDPTAAQLSELMRAVPSGKTRARQS